MPRDRWPAARSAAAARVLLVLIVQPARGIPACVGLRDHLLLDLQGGATADIMRWAVDAATCGHVRWLIGERGKSTTVRAGTTRRVMFDALASAAQAQHRGRRWFDQHLRRDEEEGRVDERHAELRGKVVALSRGHLAQAFSVRKVRPAEQQAKSTRVGACRLQRGHIVHSRLVRATRAYTSSGDRRRINRCQRGQAASKGQPNRSILLRARKPCTRDEKPRKTTAREDLAHLATSAGGGMPVWAATHLLPTRSLLTFSRAYLSISLSQRFTLLNDSLLVMS
eukprot:scaffold4264_cov116-Isochrysis_galbana.AAC.16